MLWLRSYKSTIASCMNRDEMIVQVLITSVHNCATSGSRYVTNNITVRIRIDVLVVARHYSVSTELYDSAITSTKAEAADALQVEVDHEDANERQKERAILEVTT